MIAYNKVDNEGRQHTGLNLYMIKQHIADSKIFCVSTIF